MCVCLSRYSAQGGRVVVNSVIPSERAAAYGGFTGWKPDFNSQGDVRSPGGFSSGQQAHRCTGDPIQKRRSCRTGSSDQENLQVTAIPRTSNSQIHIPQTFQEGQECGLR